MSAERPDTRANGSEPVSGPEGAPRWPLLPERVTVHASIDLSADDPALVDEPDRPHRLGARRCVAARVNGDRCIGRARDNTLACPFHDGSSDPRAAALASHEARKARTGEAERVLALQRLGTRAVVAQALVAKADKIHAAVGVLADAAAGGDLKSAQALIPWIDQALGRPTERVEHSAPSTLDDLQSLSQSQLEAMVAEGRRKRLALVDEAS